MKSPGWVALVLLTIAIKWISLYPQLVEKYYTYGIYPSIAKLQRLLLGWLPFSIGDLLYAAIGGLFLYRVFLFFKTVFQRKTTKAYFIKILQRVIFVFLLIYVLFNLFWGLNYNRQGIVNQFDLKIQPYSVNDLDTLCTALQAKLNSYASQIDTRKRDDHYAINKNVFQDAPLTYKLAADKYSFFAYSPKSVKKSMVGFLGKFIGFFGYYNPFTGEAQITTSIPVFLQPFVACHEIAHQLGYAKENEANFAGFLAGKESPFAAFNYSAYYDTYNYAIGEMYQLDSIKASGIDSSLHEVVKYDRREYRVYLKKIRNSIAPFMLRLYDGYLRMNNQPKGYRTYNEVVLWLIAYYKRNGVGAL